MASAGASGIKNVPYDLGKRIGYTDLKVGEEYYYTDRPGWSGETSNYRKVGILNIKEDSPGYLTAKGSFIDKKGDVSIFGIGPKADPDFTGDGNTLHRFYETKEKEYSKQGINKLVEVGKTPPTTASKIGKFLGLDGGLRHRGSLRRSRRNKTRRGGRKSKRRLSRRR